MKKTLIISALTLAMSMPAFAEEQFINNSKHAGEMPVFGNENQERVNLGMEKINAKEEINKARAREEARRAEAKKSEANKMANSSVDPTIELGTGRITKQAAMENLAEDDPDYVPRERIRRFKSQKSADQRQEAAIPVYVKGDHVEYDNATGDFSANGKVRVRQGDEVMLTDYCFGNFNTGDIYLLEGGTLLEPGNRTNAKWMHFNFNTKTGEMKDVSGRGTKDFYTAPHATVMPDKVLADLGGTTTRCTAKQHVPCMHVEAGSIEFYPREKMVAHDVKVYIKGAHIYSRKLWVNEFKRNKNLIRPKVGWKNKENGFYGQLEYNHPLTEKDSIQAVWTKYSRAGFKPEYSYTHEEKNWDFRYFYGWDEDDDYWYKKENDFRLRYKPHHFIKGVPLTISANWEYGLWSRWKASSKETSFWPFSDRSGFKSWHNEYAFYVNHDPIKLFGPNTTLHLTYGRKWMHEGLSGEHIATNVYYQTLRHRFNDNLYVWASNLREKRATSQMFDLGQADMDREFRVGVQYKPTKNDVLSVVNRYNYGNNAKESGVGRQAHGQYETIYNWYHRFCCWAFQVSYEKEWYKDDKTIKMQYFFYNW